MLSKKLCLCFIALILLLSVQSYAATGNINVSTRYQIIEGFGAANVWSGTTLKTLGTSNPAIYDVIFGDLGLDILRLRNTYGFEQSYIDNCQHTVTNGRARTGRPLKLMISSWSPPASLKSNGATCGGGDATLDGGPFSYVYADFADWWADSLVQYASQNMVADYVNMQNEPDYDASWDSCRFEPTETTEIAGYNTAFEAVYQEIQNRAAITTKPKMLVSDCTGHSRAGEYINNIITPSQVYGYSHHLYNCSDGGNAGCGMNPDNYIDMMTTYAASYSSKPTIMTEYSDDSHVTTYDACMDLAVLIHNSLAVENASGYIYWQLAYGSPLGLVSITTSSWTINPIYYAMKHYSAFTDPEWQCVAASTDSSDLRITAYINPDNDELSVVIINTNASSAVSLDLSFADISILSGSIYRTTSSQYCTNIGSYTGGTLSIPANSITTLALNVSVGNLQTLNCSSTSGGSVTTPGEGDFNYTQDSYANITATASQYYHFVEWTGSAVTAGKVTNPYSASTTVLMDDDYTVVANFEADPPDITPPSPNPMTWSSVPTATGATTITMTATTATDADNPPAQYYFECTNDASKSSSWQSSTTYIAQSLTPSTLYTFRVKARDNYLTPNETAWSDNASAVTLEPPTNIEILGSWVSGLTHAKESDTNRGLIFIAHGERNSDMNLVSVTYGGKVMTKIIDRNFTSGTGRAYAAAFILKETDIAAAASNTFVPTWYQTPTELGYSSAFFSNVDQINSIEASASNGNTSTSISTSPLATSNGDMAILAATCGNGGSYTLLDGFTEGTDQRFSTSTGVTGHKAASGTTVTPGATFSGNPVNRQVIIGFVVKAGSPPDAPPAAPTGLVATAGNQTISLDWNDNNETDLAGYNVYRSTTQGSGYGKINSSLVINSNYTDSPVDNWTPYYYVVTAVDDGSNESGNSNEVSATADFQSCADVLASPYRLVSDIAGNCYVDINDLAIIVQYWLETDCASYNNCDGADLGPDGNVNFFDFSDFALDWLNCNDPQDENCTKNW